jgi:hypothetical protein
MSNPKILLLLAAAVVVPVYATTIFANNPGALPGTAQDITGLYPTEIIGSIPDTTDPFLGVNMFMFDLLDPTNFSAIIVPSSPFDIPDTVLFLFDSTGRGVYMNDDISGADTFSCLPSQSALSNPCPALSPGGVGPLAPGVYYLAISLSMNYPVSDMGEIFSPVLSTDVVGPDPTQGGADPIVGWDGNAFTSTDTDLVNYEILLTGTTPEPATWIMTGAAGVAIMLLRRRVKR